MDEIIEKLQKLGFTKIESQVYYTIVKNRSINGSKVAKILNLPRTSVYSAIDTLYDKGLLYLVSDKTNEYIAKSPKDFFSQIKTQIVKDIEYLDESFSKLQTDNDFNQFYNISGYNNIIDKIKEIIKTTKKELYINTNIDISNIIEDLKNLKKNNIRIIFFSFESQNIDMSDFEFYLNDKMKIKHSIYKRVMIVSDCEKALIASGEPNGKFTGTFSNNKLLSSIISEHIHNDIYMCKLEKKYKKDLIENDILLNSLHENMFKNKS